MASGSSRWFDRRHAAERVAERKVHAIETTLKAHAAVKVQKQSDERVEFKRRQLQVLKRNAEAKQGAILEQKRKQEIEQRHLDQQQNALCNELQRRRSQEASEHAGVRRIVEQSEELRDLKLKLNSALVSKELAEQDAKNREMKRLQVLAEQQHEQELDRLRKEADAADELQRMRKVDEFKVELDEQMEYRRVERQKAYESFLEEKKHVDAVVAGVRAEEQQQRVQKAQKRVAIRDMMRQYDNERRMIRKRLQQEEADELKRIEAWSVFQQQRLREIEQKKAEHAAVEAMKYRRVADGMDQARKEQEETEQLLIELFIAEADRKMQEAAHANEQRKQRMKQEMVEDHRIQQILSAERKRNEREEEDRICKQMMEKFAQDDRLEQMAADRRRRMKQEHKREVDRLLEERRRLCEQQRQTEVEERAAELRQERERLEVVEREREKMLKDYARKLRDYLPRGVIRNKNDHEIVFGGGESAQDAPGTDEALGEPGEK